MEFTNISLIGMPGAGKSTVGVLLAKALSWDFLDTDVLIQVAEERPLHEIIYTEGIERFARIEQRHMVALDRRQHVIAVGSSAVYGPAAMQRLKGLGVVIHLDLPLPALEERLARLNGRARFMAPGQTFHGLFQHRQPLYQQYADLTIDCRDRTQEEIVDEIIAELSVGSPH
jgi:shikimate kinase